MEKLYNNILLPDVWPPRYSREALRDKITVPYLENPPEVIDITVGRQLFVDDFLIEETTLEPRYYQAEKYAGNPVFYPETPWEKDEALPCAAPKSGGVWYDEDEGIFKMWYEAGWLHQLAYAVSDDGITWRRPDLDIEKGTNKILTYTKIPDEQSDGLQPDPLYFRPDSTTVFIDKACGDKSQRYKMFLRGPGGEYAGTVMTSADGIHWENATLTSPVFDRSTAFYNPFRKKWVYSIRTLWEGDPAFRARDYYECDDFLSGAKWGDQSVHWLCTDRTDEPNPYIGFPPQLYNVDAVAYESIMLGMFQIMYGPENNVCQRAGVPKITELIPMYSRDGFHWSRPCRDAVIPASFVKGTWDRGYVQSVGGVCVTVGDELWIYYTAFCGDENRKHVKGRNNGMYAGGATGMAKLRRDGFAAMTAEKEGTLLTRLVEFTDKKYMWANFTGTLRAEILSVDGSTLAVSEKICGDSTKAMLPFRDLDIAALCGRPVRIKFTLEAGALYAFWLSASEDGESGGYHGAGEKK